ncbi:hypothetical protein [Streptomyces sp. NPDC096068]|uniref:hypothetical protein n=1 Tax=Streptomyces sp. NPDC096068 TaxID=3155424 RepID=UPI0033310F59
MVTKNFVMGSSDVRSIPSPTLRLNAPPKSEDTAVSVESLLKIRSLESELRDRISGSRELRQEASRALRFIERGNVDSAITLLRRLPLSVTEKYGSVGH